MNLHRRGSELIHQLKDHVLEVLRSHPDGGPGGKGVFQEEVARRAGLHSMGGVELDHTCNEMLGLLHREGLIESENEDAPNEKRRRWRLSQAK